MTAKFEDDYKLLRQVKDIDSILSEDFSFENSFKEDQSKHDNEISSIKGKIVEVEVSISSLEGLIQTGYEKIEECKREKEKISLCGQTDEEVLMSQDLSIQLEEQAVKKYKEELMRRKEELKMLNEKMQSIEKAFEEFKAFVNKSISSSVKDMQELRDKRLKLLGQLGEEAASAFKKVSDSIHFPVASLKDGICTNCNLENVVSMQVGIKSMEEIVTCEYCGAILVDVISSDDKESTDNVNI